VIACLTTLPNIVHSDSPSESLASSEWQSIRKALAASDDDTLVVVWGDARDVTTASQEIAIRAREATKGIPSETRQALRDGTNGFERILPGADRMYPDTDLPPKGITADRLQAVREKLPLGYWDRGSRYRALGVPDDLVRPLTVSPHAPLFEEATGALTVAPKIAAAVLAQYPRRLHREGIGTERLTAGLLREILLAHRSGGLAKEGLYEAVRAAARTGRFSPAELPPPCAERELADVIHDVLAKTAGAIRRPEKTFAIIMGLVMARLRGRIDGARVAERVAREVRQ
jgi:glutamyl-tRNA(Gln) amidotransferase subunit E